MKIMQSAILLLATFSVFGLPFVVRENMKDAAKKQRVQTKGTGETI